MFQATVEVFFFKVRAQNEKNLPYFASPLASNKMELHFYIKFTNFKVNVSLCHMSHSPGKAT